MKVNPFTNNKVIASYRKQEGHDGPEIAHLNIKALHAKEQVILYTINNI
jgi:hypothetical protein